MTTAYFTLHRIKYITDIFKVLDIIRKPPLFSNSLAFSVKLKKGNKKKNNKKK
jgi:hypothetical protein